VRQNLERAAREQRRDGRGPVYRRLLEFEMAQDRRYRSMGRPRVLLEQLQSGEPVTVPAWRIPREYWPPSCHGSTLVLVTSGM
jgi:hypothetical protein